MRYLLPLGLFAALLAGCGNSTSSKAPKASTSPRPIPQTSPAPIKGGKGIPTVNPKASPVRLPTVKSIAFPSPTAFPPSAYTASLHGTVKDSKSHAPIGGAIVVVGTSGHHVTRTDSFGRYRISFPGGVPVSVTVSRPGYLQNLAIGVLIAHKGFKRDVTLQRKGPNAAPPAPSVFHGK